MAEGLARLDMRRAFVPGMMCAALTPAMPRAGRAAASDAEAVKAFLTAIFARAAMDTEAANDKEIDGRATCTPSLRPYPKKCPA
jgi:hypothetical protein